MNKGIENDLKYNTSKYNKSLYIVFFILLFLILASTYIDLKSKYTQMERHISYVEQKIIEEYKERLKESINSTNIFIDRLYSIYLEKQKKEKINNQFLIGNYYLEFEKEVREYLYKNIYDNSRYTWINKIMNYDGGVNYAIRLIHPNLKKSEGEYLSTFTKDIASNLPYKDELDGINQNGEVFYIYYFKEYGSEKNSKKISYAKLNKNLNWIIATGIPFDILDKKIAKLKSTYLEDFNNHLYLTLSINGIMVFILIFTVYLLRYKTTKFLFDNLLKSHNKLKQSNNKLYEVTKSANIGIWEWDIAKNLVYCNEEMYKLYEVENFSLNNFDFWLNFLNPEDKELAQKLLDDSIKNKTKFSEIFKIEINSKIKYIKTTGQIFFNNKNKPLYMIGTSIDVTKIKEFDKQQLQLLEQSKLASLGEMIGNIAHQWRQPLSVINIASSGLKVQKDEGILSDELFESEINTIKLNVNYLSETIETFRDFIKEEKEYKEVIVQDRIRKTLEILDATLKNNQIKLIHNIDLIENIKVKIVVGELSQVLINILNNAKDVLRERKIDNPTIILNLENNEQRVLITIEDNAGGISEDIISHIFEPYFTTKHKSIGTGLGLYIAHKIITQSLKGKIYVKNENEGAKFYIELFHN